MNNYICSIDNTEFKISSDDFKTVKVNNGKVKVEISEISEYSYKIKVGNKIYLISITKIGKDKRMFQVNGFLFEGEVRTELEEKVNEITKIISGNKGGGIIKSPMPGLILKVNKNVGDSVEVGESLVLLEAMKMENDLKSTSKGIVKEVFVKAGQSVEKNETLLKLE